jgi:hypothetical protein
VAGSVPKEDSFVFDKFNFWNCTDWKQSKEQREEQMNEMFD